MYRYITRACIAAAAGVTLSTVGVTGPSAWGAVQRAPQAMRMSPAERSPIAASPGTQLWVKRYTGSGPNADEATSVAVSPSGKEVFVTGYSTTATYEDYLTVAYNATTGAQQWVERYNGPGNLGDEAKSVAVSPNGTTVFVTGQSTGTTSNYQYATVAYNATTGAQLWVKRYGSATSDIGDGATSVAVNPSGTTVFVTGQSRAIYATVAYNSATGAQLWVKRYSPASVSDGAASVAVSPTGSTVYVTGYDYATVAYNATTGAQVWVKRYGGGAATASSVAVSPSGGAVYVTGQIEAAMGGYNYATVAYNATTGTQLWVKTYNGPSSSTDSASSVAVSPSGTTVFVTGHSFAAASDFDYATVAYNATTGAQQWVKRYNGPSKFTDFAYSVAVSPSGGTVYVTGYSAGTASSSYDYATVAYNATTGAQQWVKRYNGPGSGTDDASWLAVSPTSGTVFVTGFSWGGRTGYDYATLAYSG